MTARGDSQRHAEYTKRLFNWELRTWDHAVRPGQENPFPPASAVGAMRYCHELDYGGRLAEYQTVKPEGREFRWDWLAAHSRRWKRILPFFYFQFAQGVRRVIVDGVDPTKAPRESIQLHLFEEVYRKIIHQDSESLGMEILIPVWKHRHFIEQRLYDHKQVTTLLLVTTEENLLDDLIARKVGEGDIGASATTAILMGKRVTAGKVSRALYVAKHRGSACSDEIGEFVITDQGLAFT
jgi:hypothetical protein